MQNRTASNCSGKPSPGEESQMKSIRKGLVIGVFLVGFGFGWFATGHEVVVSS